MDVNVKNTRKITGSYCCHTYITPRLPEAPFLCDYFKKKKKRLSVILGKMKGSHPKKRKSSLKAILCDGEGRRRAEC